MLEFIVSGHMPGTHIQITFFQVAMLLLSLFLLILVLKEIKTRIKLVIKLTPISLLKKQLTRRTV